MEAFITQVLMLTGITSMRHDEQVSRGAIMNWDFACNLTSLQFARDAMEISPMEGQIIQSLIASRMPQQSAGMNLAHWTPNPSAGNQQGT